MGRPQFRRIGDDVPPAPAPHAVSKDGLAGTWRSSDPRTGGIESIEIATGDDGTATARVLGAGGEGRIDWGSAPVSTFFTDGVSSGTCAGFRFRCELPFLTSHIQANVKLGVLVLGVHQTFSGSNGKRDCFFREFLAMTDSPAAPPPICEPDALSCLHDRTLGATEPELDLLLGSWANTNRQSKGIVALDLETAGDGMRVRVRGAGPDGPIDWDWAAGETFSALEEDAVPSAAALARYDFGFLDCELQFRQNKGILAVTSFNRFRDGSGRNDYVTRELFHRTP